MRRMQPWKSERSRTLRANATSAEAKVWTQLRNRQLAGFKFVRQAAVGPYFADFVCRERRVILEIDGATHGSETEIAADFARTAELEALGYRVFRADNRDVFDNLEGVLRHLLAFLQGEIE